MLGKISTLFMMFILFTVVGKAQWTYEGPWPDTTHKGGTHGIEVTPDGKVWTASYYKTEWNTPSGVVGLSPILVFSPDGSSIDTIYTVTTGSDIDTLGVNSNDPTSTGGSSGTRSMAKDSDGNIYFTWSGNPSRIVKINYQTYEGMARHVVTEVGSSPIAGGVSDDGNVFVGPVVGGGSSAIVMYSSTDLSFVDNAVLAPPNIARYFEVSDDGLTIYWTMFTGEQGLRIYERPDVFSAFEFTDSLLVGMSIETAALDPVTGYLWVSNDSRGTDSTYTHLTWYGLDLTTLTIEDSFSLPAPSLPPSDEFPRGLAFSPDGSAAYVGLFGSQYDRLYKFTRPVGVRPDPNTAVENYKLEQNYPNPFNPTTQINFSVLKEGYVTLKVYDILGNEVAVLADEEMTSGAYTADFNASNLASGTYIYTLSVNGVSISKKMMLLK